MEEEVIGEEPKKSKLWILFLILGIILVLIVAFIIARPVFEKRLVKTGYQLLEEPIYHMIDRLKLDKGASYTNVTNLDEARARLNQNAVYAQELVDDFKTKGEIKLWLENVTLKCSNGSIETYDPNKKNLCPEIYQKLGLAEFTVYNQSYGVLSIVVPSMILLTNEYQLYVLEETSNEKKTSAKVIAHVLDETIFLTRIAVIWNPMKYSVNYGLMNNSKTNQLLQVDVENFANSLEIPTEQQINNLDLYSSYLNKLTEAKKSEAGVVDNPFYSGPKVSFKEKALLINPTDKEIAREFDRIQKENLIKMLNSAKQEKNPYLLIAKKFFLNLAVNCPQELGSSGECSKSYSANFQSRFTNAIRS